MSIHIPEKIRIQVANRAEFCCEYCLISEVDTYHRCHIDHIISIKHGGSSSLENLAYACQFCNRYKGSDVGTFLFSSGEFVRFFNPRKDVWSEHFHLDEGLISAKTAIGESTIKILKFNEFELVYDRKLLIEAKRYPGISL